MENKNIYIRNFEGVDIYKHMQFGKKIANYSGMFPYSLELLKLESIGLKKHAYKGYGKTVSDDIINVKFGCGYKDPDTGDMVYTKDQLRDMLYKDGFTLYGEEYVLYKRSGAKSRVGNCLFIKKKLYNKMIKWSRMYIKFPKNKKFDVVGLAAYSSLVSSAIEDVITIDPDSILMIDDVESKFTVKANVISKGEDGFLQSTLEDKEITSCFTDGSCLLDTSLFTGVHAQKSMMLLRNHMFKSAGFRTKIQKFIKDYYKDGYETATVTDMFGNKMLAKNIRLICTPNSLKAFKFAKFVGDGSKAAMYYYWKQIVKQDGNLFGVCKHEKITKHIFNNTNYQQLSYQMINSMPLNKEDLKNLCSFEFNYVDKLKNDDNEFLSYLTKEANAMNCNEAMVSIAERNRNFMKTKIFKDFRKQSISSYVKKLKKGKIKVVGDYCTMVSNPYEYLQAAVGAYKEGNELLQGNQIYTSLFPSGEELVCFRNPHTSQANVYIGINTYCPKFSEYFEFSKNIVIVNSIENEICDILSGCDFDSDTALVTNNKVLLEAGRQCYKKYNVCINNIASAKNEYLLNNAEMALIDNKLAKSKNTIGQVVNIGQLAMSKYWDNKFNGIEEGQQELLSIINIMTILSGVAIDNAKKNYEMDMEEEIKHIKENKYMPKNKPLFWQYVSGDKNIKKKICKFNTPMDLLSEAIDEVIKKANGKETVNLEKLLIVQPTRHVNKKQIDKILNELDEAKHLINNYQDAAKNANNLDDKKEIFNKIDELLKDEELKVKNRKIKPETIYVLLKRINADDEIVSRIKTLLINMLYKTHTNLLIDAFVEY